MKPPYIPAGDARLAASLLLLRDGQAGLEVLMLRRAERDGDLRSGACVFPGGVVDTRDRDAHAWSLGPSDIEASARLGVAEGGLDYALAAVRECFEEVGVLLVCSADGQAVDVAARSAELHPWRERLNSGAVTLAELCAAFGWRADLRGLAYTSHWLTPPGVPKRFDTRFFCALAPVGQTATADLGEAVELMWITPEAAMSKERDLKLLPVTRQTLRDLARFDNAPDAHAEAQSRTDIQLIMPRRAASRQGMRVVLPGELPYAEVGRLDPEGRGDISCEIVPGVAVRLSARIWRVTAPNPGPMTGPGTNTYFVGDAEHGDWAVIDPGPADERHLQAMLAAAPGPISRILVTHTHNDHSPGAAALHRATGAPVFGRVAAYPQWQDQTFAPQGQPQHGDRISLGSGTTLRVIHTPGHASNHLCYLLEEEKLLFTGDHVMQGSTVVINPPDGDMADYLDSLNGLLGQDLEWLAPGHGFLVAEPHAVLRALIAHRLKREARVVDALQRLGPCTIDTLLPDVYADVSPALHPMALRSLLAHLLKLQRDGAADVAAERWQAANLIKP